MDRKQYESKIKFNFLESESRKIMLAYRLSKYGHRNQYREGGDRYFEHPKEVSLILLEIEIYDYEIIIACLLHDIMEDSFILTWEDLEVLFNKDICRLIKLVTKELGISKEDYFKRLNRDPRAIIVKLADRLHNLENIKSCSKEKQIKQIEETRTKIEPLCQILMENKEYNQIGIWFSKKLINICNNIEKVKDS